ncbi:MAG: acyl carrier protein [Nitrospirae bacterium]|nr:acyl carrier protein [Nitrospirota bacterium]
MTAILTTLQKIRDLIVENFNLKEGERIEPDVPIDNLGLDSLDKIEFMFTLEKEFNLKIPERGIKIDTVGDLVELIDKLTVEQHSQTV